MKRFFRQIAGAGFYFAVFLGAQIAVPMGIGMIEGFRAAFAANMNGTDLAEALEQALLNMAAFSEQHLLAINIAAQILALFLLWVCFVARRQSMLKQAGCKRVKPTAIVLGVGLGLSVNCLVQLAFSKIPFPKQWMDQMSENSEMLESAPLWLMIVTAVLLAPLLEEIVFRGLMHTRLRRVMPVWASAVIVSTVFGVVHGAVIAFFYTFALAMLMTLMMERYQSLLLPISIHLGFNICGTVLPILIPGEVSIGAEIALAAIGVGGTAATLTALLLMAKKPKQTEQPEPVPYAVPLTEWDQNGFV